MIEKFQSPYGLLNYYKPLPTVPRKLVTVGYIRVALRAQWRQLNENERRRRESM